MQAAFVVRTESNALDVPRRTRRGRALAGILSLLVVAPLGGCGAGPGAGWVEASTAATVPPPAGLAPHREARRADPFEKGPYAAGFERRAFVDPSRPTSRSAGGRPIAAFVFYPVDPGDVSASAPRASYPLDALYGLLPEVSSAEFEAEGLDAAYAAPRASRRGPFPLVMFSPGWTSDAASYVYAGTRLASHGFVVAVLTHDGEATSPVVGLDHLLVAAMNRPRDVSFALTQILSQGRTRGDLLHGLIDADAVAAAGHSLGGYAALALAGGDDDVCDATHAAAIVGMPGPPPGEACRRTAPDPRIRAIVHFDGTNHLLRARELSRITVPSLGVGRGQDGLALQPPWLPWNARPHAEVSSRHAFRVDLNQTIHLSYTNVCQSVAIGRRLGLIDGATAQGLLAELCSSPNPQLQGGTLRPPLESLRLASGHAIAFLKRHAAKGGGERESFPGADWATAGTAGVELFCTERGGDTSARPEDQAAYLDPAWGESFRYFAHQPEGGACDDAD
jgi:hypothetical protein